MGKRTHGGKADTAGLKVWHWHDTPIQGNEGKGYAFSNEQMKLDYSYDDGQIFTKGNRLHFHLKAGNTSGNGFNYRAEGRTMKWLVNHEKGTEEWYGFNYKFESGYVIDSVNPFVMFQVHSGATGNNALLSLEVQEDNVYGQESGRIFVTNSGVEPEGSKAYYDTGVTPIANQTINVVIHVVWGDDSNGLIEVWFDDVKVTSTTGRNTRLDEGYVGGNVKFGIYKRRWETEANVLASAAVGVTEVNTSIGALRIVTRPPSDPLWGNDCYDVVHPVTGRN